MKKCKTVIILVHGFYSDISACQSLAKVLATEYKVYSVDLPLTYGSLDECILKLKEHCQKFLKHAPSARLCFVGHSTGGLVIRGLLHFYPNIAERTYAALMVAVPNRGTALADMHENLLPTWMQVHKPISAITRQSTAALSWQWPDHILLMGIAGVVPWSSTKKLFNGLNDGVVAVSSVFMEQMEDMILLPYDHEQLMGSFVLVITIFYFLENLQLPPQLYRMNKMTIEEKFIFIWENNALDQLLSLERGNVSFPTLNHGNWWDVLVEVNGWELQQNIITKHIRLLNPSNIRKVWGGKHYWNEIMDQVISSIQSNVFIESKVKATNDPVIKRIKRLEALKEKRLITEAEYDQKRSKILAEL